jgi:hypothetical protein
VFFKLAVDYTIEPDKIDDTKLPNCHGEQQYSLAQDYLVMSQDIPDFHGESLALSISGDKLNLLG